MPLQLSMPLSNGTQAIYNTAGVVYTATPALCASNNVCIYIAAGVSTYRQIEIQNAWQWLMDGLRSRNLIERTSNESLGAVTTVCLLDRLSELNRNTTWAAGGFALLVSGTVGVALGQSACEQNAPNVIENAITYLVAQASERNYIG